MSLRAVPCLALLSLSLLAACASAPTPVKTADTYYKEGEAAFAAKNYDEAITDWKKVRETYTSPELTAKADLNIADAYFENKSYIEAAAAYENFRKLHPANEKSEYALYRLGLSHYHQITGIDTDQTPVKNAVVTLEGFLNLYPASPFAADAKQKLADCRIKQLEYENYVGSFYLRTEKYPSAIKRLNEALVRFRDNPKLDETLFYLGKAYLKSGDTAQGRATLNRLAKEYPNSPLNKDAAKLLGGFAGYSSHRG
jgi:outer membrane protein assembly factor BamD